MLASPEGYKAHLRGLIRRIFIKKWYELNQTPDIERLQNVKKLLAIAKIKVITGLWIQERAAELQIMGFSSYDATHIVSAERSQLDIFLTTDDRFIKKDDVFTEIKQLQEDDTNQYEEIIE